MKLLLLLNFVFLYFFLTASSELSSIYTPQSKIVFNNTQINLGSIPRGSKHELSFDFTNQGKDPLIIQGVHSSCGCILIEHIPTRQYLPGEHGSIKLSVDTSNFSSSFQKNVVLITNNKKEHHINLSIKANIVERISAYPPIVNFDTVDSSLIDAKNISVKFDPSISINNITYNKDILEVVTKNKDSKSLDNKSKESKSSSKNLLELSIRLKNIDFNKDSFIKEDIIVENSDINLPKLKIPVRAFIQPNISFSQNYIEFGGVLQGQTKEQRFEISSRNGSSFDLNYLGSSLKIDATSVKHPEDIISVKVEPTSLDNNKYLVSVRLKNDSDKKSSISGQLNFSTNRDTEKDIKFYALFY